MAIPFVDIKSQLAQVEQEIRQGFDRVFAHCQFIMGPEIKEVEDQLAAFAGTKHAITCSSGTDALLMPLMAMGIGAGDAVLTTPFTFFATLESIALLGATPVVVDVDPRTFNIDPAKLELAIKALKVKDPSIHPLPAGYENLTLKAIMPVDLFGLPADYDRIMAIAAREKLYVIGDSAQGFGGVYKGRPVSAIPHVTATSFFPAKPLGVYGDGGAVFTNDDNLADVMRSIRVHGMGHDRYYNVRLGLNARFDTFQAVVLKAKLRIFPAELDARQDVAERYDAGLAGKVTTPLVPNGYRSSWAQYSILTKGAKERDALQATLKAQDIPTMIYYPIPCHLQPVFSNLGYKQGSMPVSEGLSQTILSLPMHPYLTQDDQKKIIEAVKKAV
ncbi:DegT/DnrJ/EryC1/StrS family aminotransferase [Desulfocurvibacter africanus]|uniref:DegT/DnrJ/EryC1/StrS aminotransferase n=1 Tax=Desulfocurvibacter africanus subsp. africanus str. Walvis Bay TaxID=690850 RepID=F3YVS2_DESAF|nr:DegT/DnrJ/EryC1/StrS family aminotransferase [Desulfocurvibacter africanus]EGJ48880.1 DegT/DnrJ/EryC1/StrS aminotransferase [Desulfocurvibacter africanus subsp. africanus str. Walvis Bay]